MKRIRNYIRNFVGIFVRQFSMMMRDGGVVLFFLFLPLAYPIIYSLIYNPEVARDVKMIVVDHDRTPLSREFARNMDATPEAEVIGYAADLEEARRAMNDHKCYAIMEIPKGFQRKVGLGETSPAVMYCEMSLLLRYRGFLIAATNVQTAMGAEIQQAELSSMGASVSGDLMPISSIQMGNTKGGFDSFIMPGVLIFILHQCIVLAVAMMGGGVKERPELYPFNSGCRRPPIFTAMISRVLCVAVVMVLPMCFLLYYVPIIFRFPMQGDMLQIFAFLLPMVISCVFFGETLQGVVRQREDVFVIWVATSVALLFLSGLTWPRTAMSPFWQWLGDIFPATWGMEGYVKMNTNGATLAQMSDDYMVEWLLCALYGVLAYLVQRFEVLPTVRRNRKNC
jgi:ABC-2 type transport system permease protein